MAARVFIYAFEPLHAADCRASGICMNKSAMQHKDSLEGVFSGRSMKTGEMIREHWRSLVYSNLREQNQPKNM